MGEHKLIKLRVCRRCGVEKRTDAKGIMLHYKGCTNKKKKREED